MDTSTVSHVKIRALAALWLLVALSPVALASYSIGVGIADTTGPIVEINFMGYAKLDQKGTGLHLRTFSRAYIMDDGVDRFVFVSVDNVATNNDVRQQVLRGLKVQFGDMYTDRNVMISSTHTHSSAGGFLGDFLFDLTTFGFNRQSFDAVVNGIIKSIERAHNTMMSGRILVTHGQILDANINRSPQAYRNNPKAELDKYKYDVDKTLTQMQFIGADDKPLGVINWFAVHPTSMNNTNRLVSSDNVGYASICLEKTINNNNMIGKGPFVAAFASTNLGDVSPNTRGPKCEFSGKECSDQSTCSGKLEMCFASGPGKDMFESTKIIAHKLCEEGKRLLKSNDATEITGPIRVVHRYVNMPEQTAEFRNQTTGKVEKVRGCLPAMGYSFAAGTTDGPGSFAFKQGTKSSNPLWNMVRNILAKPTEDDIRCHGAKPILLNTGRMTFPYQWQPRIVSTQVARIGNVMLAGVPGEFSTMSGRRLREAIKKTTDDASGDESVVIIAGLCNTYTDYITTPEEYEVQRYEGASTIYGPHTLTIYLKQYQELALAAVQNQSISPGPHPPKLLEENLISLVPPVLYDTPKWGYNFGDVVEQPPKVASPGDTVKATFVAGNPRNHLMTDSTFLTVEQLVDNEIWLPIATDADWETKFQWKRTSVILGSSQVTITWEIPQDVKPGEYRIKHNGYYRYVLGGVYPYYGVTNSFRVEVPAS